MRLKASWKINEVPMSLKEFSERLFEAQKAFFKDDSVARALDLRLLSMIPAKES